MRRLALAAILISLAACNKNQQSMEANSVDQNLEVESIGGNDVTAIDAATNDSANMAAESEIVMNEAATLNEMTGNEAFDGNASTNEQ
jgi:hypothetical protein